MIIVKKNISVYDEINRSIVKRKRKYENTITINEKKEGEGST